MVLCREILKAQLQNGRDAGGLETPLVRDFISPCRVSQTVSNGQRSPAEGPQEAGGGEPDGFPYMDL